VNNLNEEAGLFRNDATAARIAVCLTGLTPNTQGVGARIHLVSGVMTQAQEMICGGRYLSGDQAIRPRSVSLRATPGPAPDAPTGRTNVSFCSLPITPSV